MSLKTHNQDLAKLPFAQINFVQQFCDSINREQGTRGKKYKEVLGIFHDAIQSITNIAQIKMFRENFRMISDMIPENVRERPSFLPFLENTKTQIEGAVKELIGRFLPQIQARLQQSYDTRELEMLKWEQLGQIPDDLRKSFNEQINKCDRIFWRRFNLIQFASEHQIQIDADKASYFGDKSIRKHIYPILSIDGGGIRGIIPAIVLVKIEEITGKKIAELFRLIGGTSTGGIIALGLTKPHEDGSGRPQYNAQEILNIYTHEHAEIFQPNNNPRPCPDTVKGIDKLEWVLEHPKYQSPTPLYEEKLRDSTMRTALTKVIITTNGFEEVGTKFLSVGVGALSLGISIAQNMLTGKSQSYLSHDSVPKTIHYFNQGGLSTVRYTFRGLMQSYPVINNARSSTTENDEPYFIHREEVGNFRMSFVAQATSAAPTFFPPIQYGSNRFMDGGILQNNPGIPSLLEALESGQARENMFMVSLGTGQEKESSNRSTDLATSILSTWFHITQPDQKTEDVHRGILSRGAYHRFQYLFDGAPPDLDDTSPATINKLIEIGRQLVTEHEDEIRDICKILTLINSAE